MVGHGKNDDKDKYPACSVFRVLAQIGPIWWPVFKTEAKRRTKKSM